jgi:hypothetical protein
MVAVSMQAARSRELDFPRKSHVPDAAVRSLFAEEEERDCWLARIRARTDVRIIDLEGKPEIRGGVETVMGGHRPSEEQLFLPRLGIESADQLRKG